MIFLDPFIPKDFIFSIELIMYFKFPFVFLPFSFFQIIIASYSILFLFSFFKSYLPLTSCHDIFQLCSVLSWAWFDFITISKSTTEVVGFPWFFLHAMYIDQTVSRVLLALPSDNPGYLHSVGVTRMNGSVNQSWCLSACLSELVSSQLNWLCVQLTSEVCVCVKACVIVFIVDE